MTIPMRDKSINKYPHLCYCWKCDCNRKDQCLSIHCKCCTDSILGETTHYVI